MSIEEISHANSDDAADNFLTRQFERQNGRDFLNERQQELTLRKSPNPHIPLGVRAAPAEAELTVPKTNQKKINDGGRLNDAGDIAASNPSTPPNDEPYVIDCRDLTATQLRKKYPREYDTWKNMKQRAKGHIDPQFENFCDFLACMGPCKGGTLDRIVPSDPEYALGKVRWADKRTQSVNRRNVRLIQTPDGPKTVPEIAKLQKVGESTIRMRLKNKWTDAEIWAERRSARTPTTPAATPTLNPPVVEDNKAPSIFLPKPDLKPVWEKAMSEAFPGEWHELSAWVKKQLNDFVLLCTAGYLVNHAEMLLAHTIKNWQRFTMNAKKDYGAFGSIPSRPTMAFLLKYPGAAVNLYLSDNDLVFIGTRVQPKAPLPSKPSLKPTEPASAPPAPAMPCIAPLQAWGTQDDIWGDID